MKNLFLIFCLCVLSKGYSQENYTIVSLGNQYSSQQITDALNNANLCGFYYSTEQRVMLFADGAIVHLHQESQLPSVDSNCFINKSPAHKNEYWEISPNGHLIRRIQTLGK